MGSIKQVHFVKICIRFYLSTMRICTHQLTRTSFVLQNTIHCKYSVRYTLTHHSMHSMLEHIYMYTLMYILYLLHNAHTVCTYDTRNVLLPLLLLLDNTLVHSLEFTHTLYTYTRYYKLTICIPERKNLHYKVQQ